MADWPRDHAIDRVERLLDTVENDTMPVPIREVWVFGDVALGLDPVERIDVYLSKDLLFHGEEEREAAFRETHGIKGVGETVRAAWADEYPEFLRANPNGHVAPERCLVAHLTGDEPIHLEVCNTGFEDNVTQRLEGALARENYENVLDPRGVCLWIDGHRDNDALEQLRDGEYAFPPLADALEMLGADPETARTAADAIEQFRDQQDGPSVRGDVV